MLANRLRGRRAPAVVREPLAIDALGAMAVDLPRLAQFAAGATVARAASLEMHGDPLCYNESVT